MTGQILNRFSKDTGLVDELLPITLFDVVVVSYTTQRVRSVGYLCSFEYPLFLYFDSCRWFHVIRLLS